MAVPAVSRFLGRRLARGPNSRDLIENERILATARVVLAISFLVAVNLDPTEPSRDTNLAFSLLLLYCGYSALLFAILLFEPEVTPQFTVARCFYASAFPTLSVSLPTRLPRLREHSVREVERDVGDRLRREFQHERVIVREVVAPAIRVVDTAAVMAWDGAFVVAQKK